MVLADRKSIVWIGCWGEEGRSVVEGGLLLWQRLERRDCRSSSLRRGVGGRSLGDGRGMSVDAKNGLTLVMEGDVLDEKDPLTLWFLLWWRILFQLSREIVCFVVVVVVGVLWKQSVLVLL